MLSYNLSQPTLSFSLSRRIGQTIIRLGNNALYSNPNVVNRHDGVRNHCHNTVIAARLYSTLERRDDCIVRSSSSIHSSTWGNKTHRGNIRSFTFISSLSSSSTSNIDTGSNNSNDNNNFPDKYYYEYGNDEHRHEYPILSIERIRKQIGQNRIIATKPFTWKDLQYILIEQNDPSLLSRSIRTQSRYMHYTEQMKSQWEDINDCVIYSKFGNMKKNYHDRNGNDAFQEETLFTKVKYSSQNETKWKISPTLQETKEQNIIVKTLVRNDFPYFVESNIQHWCLWKLNDYVTDEDIQLAIEELKTTHTEALVNVFINEYGGDNGNNENISSISNKNEGDNERTTVTVGNRNGRPFRLGKVLDTISWINPKHLQSLPDIDHAHILCLREQHYS